MAEMVLTCACSTLALAIFSRPEHTSLFPPSTAHRLFWAPAKDTAPETHTQTHSENSAKFYKPIISCPHTFIVFCSHSPFPPLVYSHLPAPLFFLPCVSFLFLRLSWPTSVDVQLITGHNFSTASFSSHLLSILLHIWPTNAGMLTFCP